MSTTNTNTNTDPADSTPSLNDQLVIEYLNKKGLTTTALQVEKELQLYQNKSNIEQEENENKIYKSIIAKSTGGGYGYDKDSGWPLLLWGVHDNDKNPQNIGVQEARKYLNGLTALQLWVLSLPDINSTNHKDPIQTAKQLVEQHKSANQIIQAINANNITTNNKYYVPTSTKPELLAVAFALLVHTYCELLETGMETSAHTIRDAFKPIYQPIYPTEYNDLYQCSSTEDIIKLNTHNSQHLETLNGLKAILVTIAQQQLRREEYKRAGEGKELRPDQMQQLNLKLQEYDRNINANQQKYKEYSQKATAAFEKMQTLPFLRRARAVRWQLTLSTTSYSILSTFLNSRDESLVAMSALLQTKCEMHVEHRDPLPYTPSTFIQEKDSEGLNKIEVRWATPALQGDTDEALPFPKFDLDEEYDDEASAKRDKLLVEFNRALLTNGFRRLEALERKVEYESMPQAKKLKLEGMLPWTRSNPLKPSILMTSLCANTAGKSFIQSTPLTNGSTTSYLDISTIWGESGVGLCCAKMSPPDGQRVAVGCDDSAIRIWDLRQLNKGEPSQILLGHMNGFPVFDLSWNRDGRTLLSAGGDGSIRLWDTMATGPFGTFAEDADESEKAKVDEETKKDAEDLGLSGIQSENHGQTSGAALTVYRGHTPSSVVWSVAFSPSGYYFASAGSDGSARLWTTDRPTPVRLFLGHTSDNVNCVEWHPNCNYVVTGSDDKTVRLWDIHTGNTVRILSGCAAGVNTVKISPDGKLAVAGDYSGAVYVWDLSNSKLLSKLKALKDGNTGNNLSRATSLVLAFSACGKGLATGGDDCNINIWDVSPDVLESNTVLNTPSSTFSTMRTLVLDLKYSKRNLLMSAGKFISQVTLMNEDEK